MNNNQNKRNTHARRRPESLTSEKSRPSVSRSQSATTQRMGIKQGQNHQNPSVDRTGMGENNGHGSGDFTLNTGYRPTSQSQNRMANMTPQRRVTSLTPSAHNKLEIKFKKRAEREENKRQKEEKWQKDVVRIRGGIDVFMLVIILILISLGTITVSSASYPIALQEDRAESYYTLRQITFVLLGLAVMVGEVLFIPVNFYKNKIIVWGAYTVSFALLIVTFFMGNAEGEAVRWIQIGPVNIQPSELMKISMILAIAWYADTYHRQMNEFGLGLKSYRYNTFNMLLILGIGALAVLIGKHLSGFIIVAAIGVFMMIVAGVKLKWLFGTGLPAAIGVVAVFLIMNPYALKRITTFTDKNADTLSDLYQTTQSLYAIGSGGLFGVGLGQSRQKYSYLTQAHTDFIFSIWCEEWGFIGALALVILFVLFVWRGYVIAMRAPDKFTMLVAFGITTHVGLQAFLNMCVASNIIMNTGVTLPFFSYGGSSILVLLMEMGILLSISRQYYRKKSDIEREEHMKRLGLID